MGLEVGKVRLEEYNPNWTKQFEIEKAELLKVFGDKAQIEHIGSTSIPGISAKPIIDIAVGLDSLEDFEKFRYSFELIPDYSIKEDSDNDEVLIRKGKEENRTHFIHVMSVASDRYKNSLKFRDYLRTHEEAKMDYEKLKKELAVKFADDRKSYTAAKANFIEDIIKKAK